MFELSLPYEFIGRRSESSSILDDLRAAVAQVFVIYGEHGTGKTALVESLTKRRKDQLPPRFKRFVFQSCWQEKWPNIIAEVGRSLLDRSVTSYASLGALEDLIVEQAKTSDTLIVLDNVEPVHFEDVKRLVELWTSTVHSSAIIMTSTDEMAFLGMNAPISRYSLSGLASSVAIELFGDILQQRFERESLLAYVEQLKGVPLDILYVRWLQPETLIELGLLVEQIAQNAFDPTTSIESVLNEITQSPTHFMALAITKKLEFDEGLLAFFWDRLSSGTVEAYAAYRASLVDKRLLIPVPVSFGARFRINEQIHKHLLGALQRRIGGASRIPIIHYFASEYYRRLLGDASASTDVLGSFVYHSLSSGEYQRAFRHVFSHIRPESSSTKRDLDALIEPFFELGSSTAVQLNEILKMFESGSAQTALDSRQRLRILIEQAHLACDSGQFQECLDMTARASDLLMKESGPGLLDLFRRCWYYRGVSFYNTGNPRECARSYFRIVESSTSESNLGILSLGYFAHCLVQVDLVNAVKYGAESVTLARGSGDAALLAKNLASHAEALTYDRQFARAATLFQEAADICKRQESTSTGGRELGRILGSQAALFLAQHDLEGAVDAAENAIQVSKRWGDYRRVACARQYRGIAFHAAGRQEEAINEIREAILGVPPYNGRYTIPPILTLARWKEPKFTGSLDTLDLSSEDWNSLKPYLTAARQVEGLLDYVGFWQSHFWPVLCGQEFTQSSENVSPHSELTSRGPK